RACAPHSVTRLVPQPAACKEPGNVVEGGAVARLAQVARHVCRQLPAVTELELPVDLDAAHLDLAIAVDPLCIHDGDQVLDAPGEQRTAQAVRLALDQAGVVQAQFGIAALLRLEVG